MPETWGVAGYARYGQVELELYEAVETEKLALTIRLPSVELRFTVANVDAISTLSKFLVEHYGRATYQQLHIGVLDGLSICLIKDDQYDDRFFARAVADGMIDVSIVDPVAGDFLRAAQELVSDIAGGWH